MEVMVTAALSSSVDCSAKISNIWVIKEIHVAIADYLLPPWSANGAAQPCNFCSFVAHCNLLLLPDYTDNGRDGAG